MAQSLASAGPAGSNVTQSTFLDFLGKYDDADKVVADAVNDRKDLRKAIKGAGINLAAFDRARIDADKSGEKREAEELEYRRYMTWRNKPVGFQPSMDLSGNGGDDGQLAMSVFELKRVDNLGFDAGKGGKNRTINSYTPGTEAFARWDSAWVRGQAENAAGLAKTPEAAAAAIAAGSGPRLVKASDLPDQSGQSGEAALAEGLDQAAGKRRGRPAGAKNKPKGDAAAGGEPVAQAAAGAGPNDTVQ